LLWNEEVSMKSLAMRSGEWWPTRDPAGRSVRFSRDGVVMEGTVVAVEFQEEREPTLYVDVVSPEEHRGEHGVCAKDITWLEDSSGPWAVSKTPSGRWVLFSDEQGVERSGCVIRVNSCHHADAVLDVVVVAPDYFEIHKVGWRCVKWLPT
jgi:hypothetical protein